MDDLHREARSAIEALELELIVRDFIDVLNDGGIGELSAFLADDVVFRPSRRQLVRGRSSVLAMLEEITHTFDGWRISLVNVAVTGAVVLCEQGMLLKLPSQEEQQWVMSFSSFRVEGFRISAWHQLHG
jgi:limonene-1,2-epoxide hydrolase